MCFQCHNSNDEQVYESLCEKDLEFEKWNSTSIGHLLISLSGYNGEKVHNKAKEVLEQYSKWYKGKSRGLWCLIFNPNNRLFSMPTCKQLDIAIYDTEIFYMCNKHRCKEEIFKDFQIFISNEKYKHSI